MAATMCALNGACKLKVRHRLAAKSDRQKQWSYGICGIVNPDAAAEFYFLRTKHSVTVWIAHYATDELAERAAREVRRVFGLRVHMERRRRVLVNLTDPARPSVCVLVCGK